MNMTRFVSWYFKIKLGSWLHSDFLSKIYAKVKIILRVTQIIKSLLL